MILCPVCERVRTVQLLCPTCSKLKAPGDPTTAEELIFVLRGRAQKARSKADTKRTVRYKGKSYSVPRRDTQKSRLYKAEKYAFGKDQWHDHKTAPEIDEVQKIVDRIVSSATWKRICAEHNFDGTKPVRVRAGSGNRGGARGICLTRRGRSMAVILHELAHVVTWPVGRHHWPFCVVFVDLVAMFIGRKEADALEASFKLHKVRFRVPRSVSPAVAAALRARGFALAEQRRKERELAKAESGKVPCDKGR